MPDVHALLSPSSSSRWLNCTPCALLESKLPSKDTAFTKEGTLAHAMGETLLRSYDKCNNFFDTDCLNELARLKDEAFDAGFDADEMEEIVTNKYVQRVIDDYEECKSADPMALLLIEQRVVMDNWAEGCFGTSDAVIIGNETLHVIDLKYGKGVRVSADGNTQMRLYALGAYAAFSEMFFDIKYITMSIYQPRLNHYSTDAMRVEDLLKWGEEVVRPAAEKAVQGLGDQKAGAWCRFCKCAAQCKALSELSIKAAEESFEPMLQTQEEVAHSLELLPIIQAWCNSVSEYAQSELLAGRKVPGWKLVEGRSSSKITDIPGAVARLSELGWAEDSIYAPREIKTLTELKKALGKKYNEVLGAYITKKPGKPTVAPADDPRPELGGFTQAEELFNKDGGVEDTLSK